jgi:DNA (cytosine-5)-methyltransferase 1
MNYKVIDLFSGCGGMSWGLHKTGFNIIAGIDNWEPALKTFQLNHPKATIFNADIRELSVKRVMNCLELERGELDCLIGGPPCQGFSKNVPATYRFFEDPRNQLYNQYLEYASKLFPKVIIIENVAEIFNAFNGRIRNEIINYLEKLGYVINVKILFGPDYGIPQRRKRCFFFASRTEKKPIFPEPLYTKKGTSTLLGNFPKYISAWDAISDLPSIENGEGENGLDYKVEPKNSYQSFMRQNTDKIYDHVSRKLSNIQMERISSLKAGEAYNELPNHLKPKSGYSGAYGRLDFENVAPTITRWVFHPGSGRFGHPKDNRIITIREAARLQSFSDDFIFSGSYIEKANQIGNAVPPLFMYNMSDAIKRCLATL